MKTKYESGPFSALRVWLKQLPKSQSLFIIFFSSCITAYIFVPEFLSITVVPFIFSLIPLLIVLFFFEILLLFIVQKLLAIGFCSESDKNIFSWKIFAVHALVVFAVMFLYFISFGAITSPDTKTQWNQAQTFAFNDWHPVAHTLLIWFITRFVNSYPAVVVIQLLILSLACGYLSATLAYWNLPKLCRIICTEYTCINPAIGSVMLRLWKDNAFSIFALLLLCETINIYFSKGDHLKKAVHIILTGVFIIGVSMMRHNGILLTLPFLLLLFLNYKKYWKRITILSLSVICVFIGTKTIGYSILKVEKHQDIYGESVGIFMTMKAEAYINNRDHVPADVKTYLSSVASEDDWQKYVSGNWNSVKYLNNNYENVASIPITDFAGKFIRTFLACPADCRKAFMEVTKVVWKLGGDNPEWSKSNFTTIHSVSVPIRKILVAVSNVTRTSAFSWAFLYVGFFIMIMMIVCLLTFIRNGFKSLLLIIPILSYNFITMLLLSTYKDQRFFFYNTLVFLPICMVLLFKGESPQKEKPL